MCIFGWGQWGALSIGGGGGGGGGSAPKPPRFYCLMSYNGIPLIESAVVYVDK